MPAARVPRRRRAVGPTSAGTLRPMTADALERILRAATDPRGRGPLPWAAAPIREAARVLDLRCGSGAIAGELAPAHG